ncbi:MAG: (2Fe-2S)-binding protein [Pseudomonadota bacterium]
MILKAFRMDSINRGPAVTLQVNGQNVEAFQGETVHAALLAAGYTALRTTRKRHEPRGAFCGMGVCYECLVTINGISGQRACMCLVEPGMEITLDEA